MTSSNGIETSWRGVGTLPPSLTSVTFAEGELDIEEVATDARRIAIVSDIQSLLVVLMVALDVMMARGY